jgi:hypothetical protein
VFETSTDAKWTPLAWICPKPVTRIQLARRAALTKMLLTDLADLDLDGTGKMVRLVRILCGRRTHPRFSWAQADDSYGAPQVRGTLALALRAALNRIRRASGPSSLTPRAAAIRPSVGQGLHCNVGKEITETAQVI